MGETKPIWVKLGEVDKRVLYWVLFITLIIPYIRPLGLPISIAETSYALYNFIEKLGPKDVVVMGIHYGVAAWAECLPGFVAVTKHLVKRGVKIIFWSVGYADCDLTMDAVKARVPQLKGPGEPTGPGDYKYGVDWVYMGYIAGAEPTIAQLADDIRQVLRADKYGTPIDAIPLFRNVNSARDISLVVDSTTGDYGDYYVRQWRIRHGTPVAEIGIAMIYSSFVRYYQAGLAIGALKGIRGAAEYEKLIGEFGEGTLQMDAISASHLLVIIAVIMANLSYAMTRRRGGR
ncbi:MAG: hypothetical protein N3E39_00495 [Candidatus Methanomethylicia archaeon]|nr:hypothetical protein [Candidatus Methanomethylicia archaeon]